GRSPRPGRETGPPVAPAGESLFDMQLLRPRAPRQEAATQGPVRFSPSGAPGSNPVPLVSRRGRAGRDGVVRDAAPAPRGAGGPTATGQARVVTRSGPSGSVRRPRSSSRP